MSLDVASVAETIRWLTFSVLALSTGILLVAHRRSRATVFTDVTLRATALVAAVTYLAYIAENAELFGVRPEAYEMLVVFLYLLMATFFLSVALYLYRYSRRIEGAVIVSPEFLVGLRNRMTSMYGPTSSSFISYAVGKESATKAFGRIVGANVPRALRKLPSWFRLWGYGHLRYLEQDPGRLVRVRIRGTFESLDKASAAGTCDLTRGYLAGVGQALYPDRTCEAEETRCCQQDGGDACEFTLHWFEPMPAPPPVPAPLPGGANAPS